jgi:hypothetical protein
MAQTYHNRGIDILKGLLVIGMVFRHSIMLLGTQHAHNVTENVNLVVDIVSYSGFLFCFGYATWVAYFAKETGFKRILPTALRPLVAYYLSAFFYIWFVQQRHPNDIFFKTITLPRLAPNSEFLLAFTLTLLTGFLLRKPIQYILERPRVFFIVTSLLLLSSLIPYASTLSIPASLFIGSQIGKAKYTFPLLQYFPIYLLGIYAARYKVQPNLWVGLLGVVLFYLLTPYIGISRFPPSFSWTTASIFFVMTWYAISNTISPWKIFDPLASIGANALLYLLTSNLLIFAFRGTMPKDEGTMSLTLTLEASAMIILITYFMATLVRRANRQPEDIIKTPTSV